MGVGHIARCYDACISKHNVQLPVQISLIEEQLAYMKPHHIVVFNMMGHYHNLTKKCDEMKIQCENNKLADFHPKGGEDDTLTMLYNYCLRASG